MAHVAERLVAFLSLSCATVGFRQNADVSTYASVRDTELATDVDNADTGFNKTDTNHTKGEYDGALTVLNALLLAHDIAEPGLGWGDAAALLNWQQGLAMDRFWAQDPKRWLVQTVALKALQMVLWSLAVDGLGIPKGTYCSDLKVDDTLEALMVQARQAHHLSASYAKMQRDKQDPLESHAQHLYSNAQYFYGATYSVMKCSGKYFDSRYRREVETGAFAGAGAVITPLMEVATYLKGEVEANANVRGEHSLVRLGTAVSKATGSRAIPAAGLCVKNPRWALGTWTLYCSDDCKVEAKKGRWMEWVSPSNEGFRMETYTVDEMDHYWNWSSNWWYMKATDSDGSREDWWVECSPDKTAMAITISKNKDSMYAWSGFGKKYYADFKDKLRGHVMTSYLTGPM